MSADEPALSSAFERSVSCSSAPLPMDKIARVEVFAVRPRWVFVRIETSQGGVGWGEATLEGHAEPVLAAVGAFAERIEGSDPDRIEDVWQRLYRGGFYRGGPVLMSALSGIDQALWDCKARKLGVPIYELLGGKVREYIPVYAWIGGDDPQQVADGARDRKAQGFTAVKMNATAHLGWLGENREIDALAERVGLVSATGIDVGVDFHGRVRQPLVMAAIKAIEPFRPLFAEEVLLSEHLTGYRKLAGTTFVPLALGERLYSRADFRPFFEHGIIDIAQPDLSHAGGISEVRRIAAMAEAYDVPIAPHCPIGPLALASCLQVAAATPNFAIQEMSLGIHYNAAAHDLTSLMMNSDPFVVTEGKVKVTSLPGLGIDIDEQAVREAAKDSYRWITPEWRGADGELREW